MGKSVVKNHKSQLKKSTGSVPDQYKEGFVPEVRKELNSFAKLCVLGLWGLLAFIGGLKFSNSHKVDQAEIAQIKADLNRVKILDENIAKQLEIELDHRVLTAKSHLEKKYDDRLEKLLKEQREVQKQKDKLIRGLKAELNLKSYKPGQHLHRSPAAVIPYTPVNADVLRFEQKQELKFLKIRQKEREEAFLAQANLRSPEVRETFHKMQNDHQLEVYKLERSQREVRTKFRKEKFYVKNQERLTGS